MKKLILITALALSLTTLTACGKSQLVSEVNNIEFTIPQSGWTESMDNEGAYIVSKGTDMISYSKMELKSAVQLPNNEDALKASIDEDVNAVGEISNFSYTASPDGSTQTLLYTQTLEVDGKTTTIITNDYIVNGERTIITASLTDAKEKFIKQITDIVNIH